MTFEIGLFTLHFFESWHDVTFFEFYNWKFYILSWISRENLHFQLKNSVQKNAWFCPYFLEFCRSEICNVIILTQSDIGIFKQLKYLDIVNLHSLQTFFDLCGRFKCIIGEKELKKIVS